MALIRNIIGGLIAIALIAFAVTNRQTTSLVYSPLHEPLELPLYLITLLFMGLGFTLGAVIVWINLGKTRKTQRQQSKSIKALEKEVEQLKDKTEKPAKPSNEFFPALPKATTNKQQDSAS